MSLALLLLVCAPFAAQSASPVPAPRALGSLPPRAYSVGAAFDERRECLVLFGGKRPGPGYVGSTFEHDKGGWREVATSGPSPRNSPTLAYDARRGVTVLFGGDDRRGALGDTWEWNGSAWREVGAPAASPPARSNARLAYDPKRGTTVLFGGFAGATVFADTWEWNGTRWSELDAQGPPRFLHGFAVTDEGWLTFGGSAQPPSSAPPPPSGETWLAHGGVWSAWSGTGPGARDHVTLAFDPRRRRALFYGGFHDGSPSTETWEWDGAAWARIATRASPGERGYPALVYDTSARRMLLYGGFDADGPKNDLWAWDGSDWSEVN